MKCFTYFHGAITLGIQVTNDEKLGRVLFLGQRGKGHRPFLMKLDKRNEPDVNDEMIIKSAFPRRISYRKMGVENENESRAQFTVLSKPASKKSRKALLRINTSMPDGKYVDGRWAPLKGEPSTIIEAHMSRFQQSRPVSQCADDLITISPGDAVLIMPEGVEDEERYMVVENRNGRIVCFSKLDWDVEERISKPIDAVAMSKCEELIDGNS